MPPDRDLVLSADELDQIEERAAKATAGPWRNAPDTMAGRVWVTLNHTSDVQPASDLRDARRGRLFSIRTHRDNYKNLTQREVFEARERDATFIAAARSDVPALLSEVRRLRSLEQRQQQQIEALKTVSRLAVHPCTASAGAASGGNDTAPHVYYTACASCQRLAASRAVLAALEGEQQ